MVPVGAGWMPSDTEPLLGSLSSPESGMPGQGCVTEGVGAGGGACGVVVAGVGSRVGAGTTAGVGAGTTAGLGSTC